MKFKITIHYKFKFIYMKNNQINTLFHNSKRKYYYYTQKKRSFQKSMQYLKSIKSVLYIKITKLSI